MGRARNTPLGDLTQGVVTLEIQPPAPWLAANIVARALLMIEPSQARSKAARWFGGLFNVILSCAGS